MDKLRASLRPLAALAFTLAIVIVLWARPARAQDATIEQARSHFNSGQHLYDKGDFAKAAEEFMLAYGKKPFPAFLFNAAACHENLKEYAAAIDLLERYLKEDPKAADRADVERWIAGLKEAAARPPGTESTEPVKQQRTKGLTVIETQPPGATIRLDQANGPELGKSTWSGTLPDGKHTLHVDLRGFKHEEKVVEPSAQVEFSYYYFRLAEDPEFGFLVVTSNMPDALIYLDRQPGVWGRASSERNLKKGKHHIAVAREGYQTKELDIEVEAGKQNTINVPLEVAAVGYVRVRTTEATKGAKVQMDLKEVCPEMPCRFEAPEGNHTIAIVEPGKKGFTRAMRVEKLTESTLIVKLADKPSRGVAGAYFVLAVAFGAGGFAGGYWGAEPLAKAITGKTEPADINDAKTGIAVTSYVLGGGLAALFLYFGINELVREKGAPSTGTVETRDLSWLPILTPTVTPQYAGAGATWRF